MPTIVYRPAWRLGVGPGTDILQFPARVLVIQAARAAAGERCSSPDTFCPSPRATARSASPGQSRPHVRRALGSVLEGAQFGDQAAASIDGLRVSGLAQEVGYLHNADAPVCPKL
jgi:hypothetical protein